MEKRITIGHDASNDLQVVEPMVSSFHASLYEQGGALWLEDRQSTNGTFLNKRRIKGPEELKTGDVVGLGSYTFVINHSFLQKWFPQLGQHADRVDDFITVGYDRNNDLVIPVAQVSGHHCRIWKKESGLFIEDLGSTNGTWLKGRRLPEGLHRVDPGQVILLGSHQLVLDEKVLALTHSSKHNPNINLHASSLATLEEGRSYKLGRDTAAGVNDLVLEATMVSNEHCSFIREGTLLRVTDLGSTNGTYLNSPNNRIETACVSLDDIIFLGSYRLPVTRLVELAREAEKNKELSFPEDKSVITLGRDPGCDVTFDASQVSRQHARISKVEDRYKIEDLSSANGVFVNGTKVKSAWIVEGDLIGLGSYRFTFQGNLSQIQVTNQRDCDAILSANQISFQVKNKSIIKDISFVVYPTEFIGLMGPSGSGKTTLMMSMNGYLRPSQGEASINGIDLYKNMNLFRGDIGYLPQDDIIHPQLTVWESLYYTALLRFPPDVRKQEIQARLEYMLKRLGLYEKRDVLIGSAEKKGISGGQRKRVNLAQELLTQPSVLFLDEPTSGLASEDTINVMRLLREMANEGKTIVLTIHQPSLEAYRMMDNILYLVEGEMVYYGPSYPDSIEYFYQQGGEEVGAISSEVLSDPGKALQPVTRSLHSGGQAATWSSSYKRSSYYQDYVAKRLEDTQTTQASKPSAGRRRYTFGLRQWLTLTKRYARIKWRDKQGFFITLGQAPVIGLLLLIVFRGKLDDSWLRMSHAPSILFLLVISSMWFGCSNASREIVSERAIYLRERMVTLRIPSYLMSKFFVLSILSVFQCFLLLLTVYYDGLKGPFLLLWLVLSVCSTTGVALGLMLSSLVKTSQAATAFVPLLLIPQIILGGLVMPVPELGVSSRALSSVMPSRWAFEAILHEEARTKPFEISTRDLKKRGWGKELHSAKEMPTNIPPNHPMDRYFGDYARSTLWSFNTLWVMTALYLLMTLILLKRRDYEQGR